MNPAKGILEWVQKASPVALLAAMFAFIAAMLTFIAYMIPEELVLGVASFVVVYVIIVASRLTQAWQAGVEVHHLFTICFALVYGPLPAIALTIASSITNIYAATNVGNPLLVHTVAGPLQQSLELLIISVLAGFLGQFAPGFALENLVMVGTGLAALGVGIEKVFCNMFCGIDPGRLGVAWTVNTLINYNLFLFFGHQVILWMQAF